jgi:hypothetical protein
LDSNRLYNNSHPEQREWFSKLLLRMARRRDKLHAVRTLRSEYVKSVLVRETSLSYKDVPPSLVEVKRKQIKLNRLIKERNHV